MTLKEDSVLCESSNTINLAVSKDYSTRRRSMNDHCQRAAFQMRGLTGSESPTFPDNIWSLMRVMSRITDFD